MRLELENGTTIESPTASQIAEALSALKEDEANSFAILSRDDDTYMQTATALANGFILEHQAGSVENHYGSVEDHLALERVIQAFQAYASGDDSWRTSFTWAKVDF